MKKNSLHKLMEAELDKAETILAVKDLGDNVQGIAEDVAKMRVDKLMPLVEKIKEQFDQQTGDQFQQQMDAALEELQDLAISTKNQIDDQVAVLNGDAPAQMPSDMTGGNEMDPMSGGGDMDNAEIDDMFGADDVNVGGNEPMGRMRKESIQLIRNKMRILEKKMGRKRAK